MSAITDKWLKAVPLYTDTLAGAISNATVTTFQVTNGSTDLENGEVYEVTIDRVTAQGVLTGRREVVIAQYTSATKTFDCSSADYRGIEGTAQAHPVGAVVEILVTAHYLNEHRAAFLVGHTQAGAHASALPLTSPVLTTPKVVTSINDANGNEVIKTPATTSAVNEITVTNAATGNSPSVSATGGDDNLDLLLVAKGTGVVKAGGVAVATGTIPVKASGAELTTGTDDAKFATAKAMADAGLNTRLSSKVVTVSKDVSATGDQAITGVGFTPTSIILFLTIGGTKNYSSGICDSTLAERCTVIDYAGNGDYTASYIAFFTTAASQVARAIVKSFDADGFTLTWDKVNSPTGTANGYAICFR